MLIERQEGVETSSLKMAYSKTAGTGAIEFENVKVPARNLLGKEHKGFIVIMSNFNHVSVHSRSHAPFDAWAG